MRKAPNSRPNKGKDILVERAAEADLPLMRLLLSELIDAMEDTEGFDIETAVENCHQMLVDASCHILVARDGSRLLGFVNFTTRRTVLHPAPSALIDEIVVSKGSRRRGVGRLLIQAVIEECRRLGCSEVEVSTENSNLPARRFYKSCGFDEDAVLLERNLSD